MTDARPSPSGTTDTPLTWVVGGSGLLGSSVRALLEHGDVWQQPTHIPWGRADEASAALAEHARSFLVATQGRSWRVAWCAGVGVSGTAAEDLDREVAVFVDFLAALEEAQAGPEGALFLASSAGGVYSGAALPPFDELTTPRAISPYGEAKLRLEQAAEDFHRRTGTSVLVGRIANLYGPGQDISKPQGLISHICRSQLLRVPISIYVPLDTMRNYLFAPDCGAMVVAGLERLQADARESGPQYVVKVLASPHAVPIAFLVAELGRILKRRPQVVYGSSPSAAYQSLDLRVRSVVWPEIDALAATPLVTGMSATIQSLRGAQQRGELS